MIFGVMAVGFILKKFKILGAEAQKNFSDLVLYVILPCNILVSFMNGDRSKLFTTYLPILLIGLVQQVALALLGKLLYLRQPKDRKVCLKYATFCSNSGFIGVPFIESYYATEGALMANIFIVPMRVFMFALGIPMFSGVKKIKELAKKVLLHPCIIASVLGVIFLAVGFKLPAGLYDIARHFVNCNTAMSMIVVGMILADIRIKEFLDGTVLYYSVLRLVAIPAAVFGILKLLPLGLSHEAFATCVLLSGMPAGATTSILADKYGGDGKFGTKLVVTSTLLSLPTLLLWSLLVI